MIDGFVRPQRESKFSLPMSEEANDLVSEVTTPKMEGFLGSLGYKDAQELAAKTSQEPGRRPDEIYPIGYSSVDSGGKKVSLKEALMD